MRKIMIAPQRQWQAYCECGWSQVTVDRSDVITAARLHRREAHAGQAEIRGRFAKGSPELGAVIAPALKA